MLRIGGEGGVEKHIKKLKAWRKFIGRIENEHSKLVVLKLKFEL
jgi:hypothetical protein